VGIVTIRRGTARRLGILQPSPPREPLPGGITEEFAIFVKTIAASIDGIIANGKFRDRI
jgi:hypothetical protein